MSDRVTDAELDVLEALWADAPAAAADIAERLRARKDWSAQTIKTLLARLVEKGVVAHEPDGRRYLYRPTIARADYARRATRSFVDRLFDGSPASLVANLAGDKRLSDAEISELENLIRELKRDAD